ncbi:DUF3298 and DUF4163 domain-containing protein [Maribacter sp.]|nr:DUF3298 and DUF4163 domain-containing protein [Maribacter sp.]
MKSALSCLLVFLLLISCSNSDKLTFKTLNINEQDSLSDGKECLDCPKVTIAIPKALENAKIAKTINTALEEEIISLLLFDDELTVNNMSDAIVSFNKGYQEMKTLFEDESPGWEAKINGEVIYEDASLLTVELSSYIFTGGAHGYTSKRFLNFDKNKGTELENWELFNSTAKFEAFAETKFREQEAIPENASINHTGLMFEKDSFYLPENIGFTKDGLKLLYNPYEVASFADGPIELVLSHTDINKYLSKKPKS